VTDLNAAGWLFVPHAAVPAKWRDRAVPMALVPLLPDEVAGLLDEGRVDPHPQSPERVRLMHLVARGLPNRAIARDLAVSPRTLDRRLQELREELGVTTTSRLATVLSRQGFGR
jgi:DNA-binding NarL/FixJ family response regulator